MCGCSSKAQATTQWTVTPADGTGVRTFSSKPEADVYAARKGGVVRQTSK